MSAEAEARDALEGAIELYYRSNLGALIRAVDPFERFDTIVGTDAIEFWAADHNFEVLFQFGDEAFEGELDRVGGAGQGNQRPLPLPTTVQRLHDGERGGYDSASCRSCHFSGGADGAGTLTQVALLRGDGVQLESATVRDAPHVMGLGYVQLYARQLESRLDLLVQVARSNADLLGEPVTVDLDVDGLSFGVITSAPDGTLNTSGVEHISPDLVLRPFGHKGRHPSLEALSDEAFQIHHGLQSSSRLAIYQGQQAEYLGDGPETDPDGDGVELEVTEAHAVLLAGYMSMLPIPVIQPPEDPELIWIWQEGSRTFDAVGCGECHRRSLALTRGLTTTLRTTDETPLEVAIDLAVHGEDPKPARLDFGRDLEDEFPAGVPFHPFSDFRRHDMGPELAEPIDEVLPDGAGAVPGEVWLTRSLWGVADTAPYLHDGRAPGLHDAIMAHGGEAEAARLAYEQLAPRRQGALRVFLMSLTREPFLAVE